LRRNKGIKMSEYKKFDLNIESILEDWEIYHGLREIIANAMDEHLLTNTQDVEIVKDQKNQTWHIRDYGRGINHEHLTQNENEEKTKHEHTIGKFGIGLKDALATFDRKGVKILMQSKFNDITTGLFAKPGFNEIMTLHAIIYPPTKSDMIGTEVILENINNSDMEMAKKLFLKFSGDELLEKTVYGEVLEKSGQVGHIYINGVLVAKEENYLFSYNITALSTKIEIELIRQKC